MIDKRFEIRDLKLEMHDTQPRLSTLPHLKFQIPHLKPQTSIISLILTLFLVFPACRRYNTQQVGATAPNIEKLQAEALIRVHRQLVDDDAATIQAFASSRGWQMNTTASGLCYMIYHNGSGEKAAVGKIATINGTLSLLDGTICYTYKQQKQKEFRIGQGGVEAGLEEGILLMRTGDKAQFILPPHLAHGLSGDGNCIPPRAIILYDIELEAIR